MLHSSSVSDIIIFFYPFQCEHVNSNSNNNNKSNDTRLILGRRINSYLFATIVSVSHIHEHFYSSCNTQNTLNKFDYTRMIYFYPFYFFARHSTTQRSRTHKYWFVWTVSYTYCIFTACALIIPNQNKCMTNICTRLAACVKQMFTVTFQTSKQAEHLITFCLWPNHNTLRRVIVCRLFVGL